MCVCMHACLDVKVACALGDSDFKTQTPCCAAITFKGRRAAAQRPLFCVVFSLMKFLLQDFIRTDALETVCSLLCSGCDWMFFNEDEGNVNPTSEAQIRVLLIAEMTVLCASGFVNL